MHSFSWVSRVSSPHAFLLTGTFTELSRSVELVDESFGTLHNRLRTPAARPNQCDVSPDGNLLVSLHPALQPPVMSHFLTLPREIRNEVYSYIFHDVSGLLYRPDEAGVCRLYSRPERVPPRRMGLKSVAKIFFGRITKRHRKHDREANQLKYVCKQLYAETKALHMRHSLVVLQDSLSWNAVEHCASLLCRRQLVRHVLLKCSLSNLVSEDGIKHLLVIAQHCLENGDARVRVHMSQWTQIDPDFVLHGLSHLYTIRKDILPIAQLARTTAISFLSDPQVAAIARSVRIPENLRWFPREEHCVRPLLAHNLRHHHLLSSPAARVALDGLLAMAEAWFVHGI